MFAVRHWSGPGMGHYSSWTRINARGPRRGQYSSHLLQPRTKYLGNLQKIRLLQRPKLFAAPFPLIQCCDTLRKICSKKAKFLDGSNIDLGERGIKISMLSFFLRFLSGVIWNLKKTKKNFLENKGHKNFFPAIPEDLWQFLQKMRIFGFMKSQVFFWERPGTFLQQILCPTDSGG